MFLKSLLFLSAPLIQFWLRREEGSFNYVKYPSSFFKTQVAREIFVEIVVGEAVEVRSRAFVCCCRQPLATIVFGSFSNKCSGVFSIITEPFLPCFSLLCEPMLFEDAAPSAERRLLLLGGAVGGGNGSRRSRRSHGLVGAVALVVVVAAVVLRRRARRHRRSVAEPLVD